MARHSLLPLTLGVLALLLTGCFWASQRNSTSSIRAQLSAVSRITQQAARDDNPSTTVADPHSKHNFENQPREVCDFAKHKEAFVHVAVPYDWWNPFNQQPELLKQHTHDWKTFLESLPPKMTDVPQLQDVHGRGIVISGGPSVFNSMVLVIRMLRALGCKLPIEVWHFAEELNTFQLRKLGSLGVSIRNIGLDSNFRAVQLNHSMAKPYDVKSAAMLNSAFEEVLWLDADTVPTRDPTYLFDTPEFKETGMLAWPDFWSADPRNPIYKVMEVPCYREREFETGQLLINKRLHWRALNLAWYLNKRHPFYYKLLFGDKDTFRFAWKAVGAPYHLIRNMAAEVGFMTEAPPQVCGHTLGHHDPQGRVVFLHAHLVKWHEWKGDYRYSHFRDMWNNWHNDHPWTHVQEPNQDVLDFSIRPTWSEAWPQYTCLQLEHMKPGDEDHTVRFEERNPNRPGKKLVRVQPFDKVVDYNAFYTAFHDVDGPMLVIPPY